MALLEILRERTGRMGGSAQVDCGELGVLTVEALSPSDCARLSGDSRSLLYAACRELQLAGEAMRGEGKIFRPDEVVAYLTDDEADKAARTILELSGSSGIRLQSVQGHTDGEAGAAPRTGIAIRPESVQTPDSPPAGDGGLWADEEEIRPESVQGLGGIVTENGQVSHEFWPLDGDFQETTLADNKAQILGDSSVRTAQILASKGGEETRAGFQSLAVKSDLHEIKAEYGGADRGILHETESDLQRQGRGLLHETTSDSGGRRGILLHESESEYALVLHEIKSELQKALHELKSEVAETLHETKSDLAEEAAQRLAEALKQAGQVR